MSIYSPERDALLDLGSRATKEKMVPLPSLLFAKLYLVTEHEIEDLHLAGTASLGFPVAGGHTHAAVLTTTRPKIDNTIGRVEEASFAVRCEQATEEDCLRFGLSALTSVWYQLLRVRQANERAVVFEPTNWVASGQLVYPSVDRM